MREPGAERRRSGMPAQTPRAAADLGAEEARPMPDDLRAAGARVGRAEGDSRGADLRVARAADAEGDLTKLLDSEPKEDVAAALAELKQDYERPGGLQLVEVAGGYQIVTRSRSARVGAPPVPRAQHAEAVGAGARNAGGDRLPAADHRRSKSPRSAASTPPAC